ncbi:hypothetical protein HMPREF9199_1140 [Veillonella sp. oral taxon 158 str. F0412]|nr:hypothetical protein HMPREF9199_1140 [Veillonella sp. oral taxon 158 str. F0412]
MTPSILLRCYPSLATNKISSSPILRAGCISNTSRKASRQNNRCYDCSSGFLM